MIPDFRFFRGEGLRQLAHSAKGTTWTKKNAKYTDKVKTASGKIRYIYGGKSGGSTAKTGLTSLPDVPSTGKKSGGTKAPANSTFTGIAIGSATISRDSKMNDISDILAESKKSGTSFRSNLSTEQKNNILNNKLFDNSEEKKTLVKNISDAIDSKEIGRAILMFDQKTGTSTIKVDGCEFKIPMEQISTHQLNPKPGKFTDIYIGVPGTGGQVVRLADNSYGFKQLETYRKVKQAGISPAKAQGNKKKSGALSGLGNLMGK